MIRYAVHMHLRPGAGPEYDRLHAAVDPEVLEGLRRATVRNYTIFRDGEDLFGYMEVEDPARFAAEMKRSDPGRPWARAVIPLFERREIDEETGFPPRLTEVFRFD